MESTPSRGFAQVLYPVPGELLDTNCVPTERCFIQSKESVTYHVTSSVRMNGINTKKKPCSAMNVQ